MTIQEHNDILPLYDILFPQYSLLPWPCFHSTTHTGVVESMEMWHESGICICTKPTFIKSLTHILMGIIE